MRGIVQGLRRFFAQDADLGRLQDELRALKLQNAAQALSVERAHVALLAQMNVGADLASRLDRLDDRDRWLWYLSCTNFAGVVLSALLALRAAADGRYDLPETGGALGISVLFVVLLYGIASLVRRGPSAWRALYFAAVGLAGTATGYLALGQTTEDLEPLWVLFAVAAASDIAWCVNNALRKRSGQQPL